MNNKTISEIFTRFQKVQPNPTTELNYGNSFQLLVAVVLSAQTSDVAVNRVTEDLFKAIQTPEQMVKFGEIKLQEQIKSIGLFRVKAANIIKICKILILKYKSQVPSIREEIEKLPGVGRKTANVILNTAFKEPTIAVDRHIFRVANRIGLVVAKNTLDTELQLLKIIPEQFILNAHHWFILHGRYICVARKPKCEGCIIRDLCEFPGKT